jgi:hypothetical protein
MTQLIITMREDLAERFAKDRKGFDFASIFAPFQSLKLIGRPGYSTRVRLDEAEVPKIKAALARQFIVEDDFVMQVLGTRASARPAPRVVRKQAR